MAHDEYERSGFRDRSRLDAATQDYLRALNAKTKPPGSYVEAKAHIGLGSVYVLLAQTGEPFWFPTAQHEYQTVITEYEGGNKQIESIAAYAYLGLGVVRERWNDDWSEAAHYYCKSLKLASDNHDLRGRADAQLRVAKAHGFVASACSNVGT